MHFLIISENDFFFFSWNKMSQHYKFSWNSCSMNTFYWISFNFISEVTGLRRSLFMLYKPKMSNLLNPMLQVGWHFPSCSLIKSHDMSFVMFVSKKESNNEVKCWLYSLFWLVEGATFDRNESVDTATLFDIIVVTNRH